MRFCRPCDNGQMEPLIEKQIKAELYEVLRAWLPESSGKVERRPSPEQAAMVMLMDFGMSLET